MTTIQGAALRGCFYPITKLAQRAAFAGALISSQFSSSNVLAEDAVPGTEIKQSVVQQNPSILKHGMFFADVYEVLEQAEKGNVKNVAYDERAYLYQITLKNDFILYLHMPREGKNEQLISGLRNIPNNPIEVYKLSILEKLNNESPELLGGLVFMLLTVGTAMGGIAFVINRQMNRKFKPVKSDATFDDFRGNQEVLERIKKLVKHITDRDKNKVGAVLPRGILLVGPPGNGKTLLARIVAGESKSSFFNISASDIINAFLGSSPKNIQRIFKAAREHAPSIIYLDELESLGAQRSNGTDSVSRELNKVLTQLLIEMDGFDKNANVMVLASTNVPEFLDSALVRAGRFDMKINIQAPQTVEARLDVLKKYTDKKLDVLSDDVDINSIATQIDGLSGADIENLVHRAALCAFECGQDKITMANFDRALKEIKAEAV